MRVQYSVSIHEFKSLYRDEEACLRHLLLARHGGSCVCGGRLSRVRTRRCYSCVACGRQVYPTAGTIFHGSTTSLTKWFEVIYLCYMTRNGLSARTIQRYADVTLKTAWRMGMLVRKCMREEPTVMQGIIEVDESFFGGRKTLNKEGKKGIGDKMVVFGMKERRGKLRVFHIPHKDADTILPLIEANASKEAKIFSDRYVVYTRLTGMGYHHRVVGHKQGEQFRRGVNTHGMEGSWSNVKATLFGTFRHVSRRHLQAYLDEFCFRHNWRRDLGGGLSRLLQSAFSLGSEATKPPA